MCIYNKHVGYTCMCAPGLLLKLERSNPYQETPQATWLAPHMCLLPPHNINMQIHYTYAPGPPPRVKRIQKCKSLIDFLVRKLVSFRV